MTEPSVDFSIQMALADAQRNNAQRYGVQSESLMFGNGGGTSGGMEARVAKLEAQMEHVSAELAKLSSVPVDVAGIKERLQHLPTKDEVRTTVDGSIDRLGTRVQRTITIAGIGLTILFAAFTLALRFLAP